MKNLFRNIKTMLNINPPCRKVCVNQDDVFLVSYPKSGNTWLRFLMANILSSKEVSFSVIDNIIPDIYQMSTSDLTKIQRPRILKSHEYFDPDYKKVVYVVRDPRDVFISYYNYHKKLGIISETYCLDLYLERFLNGKIVDSENFGTWEQNVLSWYHCADDILIVRYEDLRGDTEFEMKRILDYLKFPYDIKMVEIAIQNSSIKNMRELEKSGGKQWSTLKKAKGSGSFVGQGGSGGFHNKLSISQIKKIQQRFEKGMTEFGYEFF